MAYISSYTGEEIDLRLGLLKKLAPRNLLDNSDFTNPVNQLGKTVYQMDSGSTLDKWFLKWSGDGSVTINDGYITLYRPVHSTYLFQNIPLEKKLIGKTVTVATRIRGNGSLRALFQSVNMDENTYFDSADWTTVIHTFTVPSYDFASAEVNGVSINTSGDKTVDCQWMALYEGEYTIDTLPAYQPKGYNVELLNCGGYARCLNIGG